MELFLTKNKKAIQNFVKILRKNYIKNAHKQEI